MFPLALQGIWSGDETVAKTLASGRDETLCYCPAAEFPSADAKAMGQVEDLLRSASLTPKHEPFFADVAAVREKSKETYGALN